MSMSLETSHSALQKVKLRSPAWVETEGCLLSWFGERCGSLNISCTLFSIISFVSFQPLTDLTVQVLDD